MGAVNEFNSTALMMLSTVPGEVWVIVAQLVQSDAINKQMIGV